ncbi:N-acyl-phosphatidylethanolamine-hydrolyzing phospholipase D [Yamadazyma tenuis]|uniref:Metallo-hydrolase/oxidoreductase n=1 Tax=Candida tenuis (strain ATCC 10573 / BCRC 21748 / CBS 615 / JCM 9827 / NBRC 10315 / NRRL Y-1498 / VKM Y-70) TaxID=590646 RepID=G3AZ73_CANTC|nr:Metallo-hydrolase/oxidoreductase [Yamadazyma tenuis ATCC 10573]EGV66024.1 Metallo-hydrolase/oxidoreductase [Yamadazyma tenuis ATCC 10573]WEJ95636.1 N-acyl-phosphatidylethanolamine-hydrolyzing phospholipase D [Yamadazyma tenuis]
MWRSVFQHKGARISAGLLGFYAGSEVYLYFQTQSLIKARQHVSAAMANPDDIDITKFKSATVAGMFVNPFEEYRPQTGFEFMCVRVLELVESFYGNRIELHEHLPNHQTTEDYLKVHKPDLEIFRKNSQIIHQCATTNNYSQLYKKTRRWFSSARLPPLSNQLLFTWLGQSCSLIQISGINILTDPILSDYLIMPHVGPKRLNKSPMTFEDIQFATNNKLDFIMVSHDHPDHLENDLIAKFGNSSTWIVPVGLRKSLARKGVFNVIEMDWWDSVSLNEYMDGNLKDIYEVVCVPSMHWSGRYIVDANFSLWCSYILRKNGKSILYHAGDTGYSKQLFDIIGKKYGPISFSLLPIGQYCPSWHQKPRHISPEECIQICQQTHSKYMMGVHWGTFKLSSEPILEPKNLLTKLSSQLHKLEYYRTPEFGLTYLFDIEHDVEYKLH